MKKRLPMTALITGLLAAPAMGGIAVPRNSTGMPASSPVVVQSFPVEMPAEVPLRLRRWARGEKLDSFGMQTLQGRIAHRVSDRIAQAIARVEQPPAARQPMVSVEYVAIAPSLPAEPVTAPPHMAPVAATKTVTFLGVKLLPVSDTLADQLHLSRGMGMLVDTVTADSPAERGGLKINDILQKLDDQVLVNDSQIQTLVHAKKAGEAVTFTLLRGGESLQVKVTLGEKQVAAIDVPTESVTLPGHAPTGQSSRTFSTSSMTVNEDGSVMRTLKDDQCNIALTRDRNGTAHAVVYDARGRKIFDGPPKDASAALPADLADKVNDLARQSADVRVELPPAGAAVASAAPGNVATRTLTLERDDGTHKISLREDATGKHVTIRELATGKELYNGPVETGDDLRAKGVPADVVEKVKLALAKVK